MRAAIHGHALVSGDDCIATPDGRYPEALFNAADWALFQAALAAATLTVVGRLGHEAHPPHAGRRRLVFSRGVGGFEERNGVFWFNPDKASWRDVEAALLPEGGVVAVTGGTGVFGWFLAHGGFDRFDLSRKDRVTIPGGRRLLPEDGSGRSAEERLRLSGLVLTQSGLLDPLEDVIFRRYEREIAGKTS